MVEPTNLRMERKKRVRAEKSTLAENNRVKFGRTKAEKLKVTNLRDQSKKKLDGHKLTDKGTL